MKSPTPESAWSEPFEAAGVRSYRALVWSQFRRDKFALIAVYLIGGLFIAATLAPILAGGRPLLMRRDGALSSPLLREFFAPSETSEGVLERAYNFTLTYTFAALLLMYPGRWLLRLAGVRPPRRTWAIVLGVLAVVLAIPFLLVQSRLDKTDYRQLTAAASGTSGNWAVFPPIQYGPLEQTDLPYQKPGATHRLGTDNVGRDVLSRLIHGSRVSLAVGFVSESIAITIGLLLGSLAAYHGRWVDFLLSRFIEIVICFPTFLLILIIVAYLDKRSIFNIMLVIGLTGWTDAARLVRAEMLKQKQLDYTAAARALGAGHMRIILRHLLPNSIAPVLVSATFGVAGAILTESGLSFLGFGVQPPTPSWGELLNQARAWPAGYWWLTVFPGVAIFFTVTIYNLVGEGFRDALDPRLKA